MLRVIGADGEQAGVMGRLEALTLASDAGLDLVEVSPTAEPPVVRVMDFGKYLFEQNKKAHSAKRKQKQIQVKEVKFRPGTEEGDYQVKLRNLTRFLDDGDKAKVKVPEGTQTGTTLRLRNKGMPDVSGRGKGDLLVTVTGTTPKKLTREQKKLMEQLAAVLPKEKFEPTRREEDSHGIFDRVKDIFG